MPVAKLGRRNTEIGIGAALDFTSASSGSSDVALPDSSKPEGSKEKVCAWLRGDHDKNILAEDFSKNPEDDAIGRERKALENKLTYEFDVAAIKKKVQCLLSFGEYSLFKKWKVLAEGDFIPFLTNSAKSKTDDQRLIKKRSTIALRDVRTLALTKNWLVICQLSRLYQVERDAIIPSGISLEIRRLVPLRYLRVCVARPAARVIGIANQAGLMKEYQMLDKPTPTESDPFITWRRVIGSMNPTLDDDTLYVTLQTFDRWQRQHVCRVTIYPGHQQKAGMSLNEWQVSLGDKEPSKCRCDETPKPKPKPPPPPPAPLPSPPKPPSSESTEPYEYITGNETSIGGNTAMSAPEENEEIVGVEVEVGSSREMSPRNAAYVVGSEVDCPTASAGRQRKKSIRTIFRLGFLTTKSRKKNKGEDKTPSPDAGYKYPPANNRLRQRRISRLEMNEPIEDIFSEVKFETIPKRPSSANSGGGLRRSSADDDESDDDIMEDPEVIMQSFLKTNSGQVAAVDVTDDHHDAANKSEKELLLPEDDDKPCSLVPLCDDNRKEVSEEDLR